MLLGFTMRGFIWDIPILIFAYVLFWCPICGCGWRGELGFRVLELRV